VVECPTGCDQNTIIFLKKKIWHDEVEAGVKAGQAIGEVRASDLKFRRLVVLAAQAPATDVALHRHRLAITVGMRMDAEHGDGTAKRFQRHIQQEQARDAAVCGRFTITTAVVMVRDAKKVEAVTEPDKGLRRGCCSHGGARPVVCTGEVVQESGYGADEAARLAEAVARRVRAHLTVALPAVVGWRRVAAVSRVWAGDADGAWHRR